MPGPASLYNRSLAYLDGKGVAKDEAKAFSLNAEAAQLRYREAVLAMGWFYLNGVGVERDLEKAQSWYRKSARHGDVRAMFSLGQMAYDQRSYGDALAWFTRAAEKGHPRSLYWLGKLHWHGRGVTQNKRQGMAFFQQAARKKVREAQRTLRFLSKPRTRGRTTG